MKLFGYEVRKITNANTSLPAVPRNGDVSRIYRPMTVEEQLSNTTVTSCVSLIADTIASMSLNVYRKTNANERMRDDGPNLSYVLRKVPNYFDTPFTFKQAVMLHLLLRGNAFIFIDRYSDYSVKALTPLFPDDVKICFDSKGDVYYEYHADDHKVYKYTTEHILHIPAYRLKSIRGLSPMEYANQAARLGLTLDEYTNESFDGGIHSKLMLEVPVEEKKWTKEDSQKLQERIQSVYAGRENMNKALILSQGIKGTPLNLANNSDAQLSENRTFSEKEVAKIYRVPLYMLGKDDSKFTNQEQANTFFLQHTLSPWLVRIQQYLDRLLTYPYNNDHYIEFDPDTLLRADYQSRMDGFVKGITNGIYTLNQVMDMENLPRLPAEIGDKHFMQVNLTTADKLVQQIKNGNSEE